MKTSMTFHGRKLRCEWEAAFDTFRKKAELYSATCLEPPRFLLPTTAHDIEALSDLSCKRLFSHSSCFFFVMLVFVSLLVFQSYECVCHPGWEGEFCQQEIDECSSRPCKNGATCADLLNGYK